MYKLHDETSILSAKQKSIWDGELKHIAYEYTELIGILEWDNSHKNCLKNFANKVIDLEEDYQIKTRYFKEEEPSKYYTTKELYNIIREQYSIQEPPFEIEENNLDSGTPESDVIEVKTKNTNLQELSKKDSKKELFKSNEKNSLAYKEDEIMFYDIYNIPFDKDEIMSDVHSNDMRRFNKIYFGSNFECVKHKLTPNGYLDPYEYKYIPPKYTEDGKMIKNAKLIKTNRYKDFVYIGIFAATCIVYNSTNKRAIKVQALNWTSIIELRVSVFRSTITKLLHYIRTGENLQVPKRLIYIYAIFRYVDLNDIIDIFMNYQSYKNIEFALYNLLNDDKCKI